MQTSKTKKFHVKQFAVEKFFPFSKSSSKSVVLDFLFARTSHSRLIFKWYSFMKMLQVFPWNNYSLFIIHRRECRPKKKKQNEGICMRKQCEHWMTKRLVSAIQPNARSHNNPYRFHQPPKMLEHHIIYIAFWLGWLADSDSDYGWLTTARQMKIVCEHRFAGIRAMELVSIASPDRKFHHRLTLQMPLQVSWKTHTHTQNLSSGVSREACVWHVCSGPGYYVACALAILHAYQNYCPHKNHKNRAL